MAGPGGGLVVLVTGAVVGGVVDEPGRVVGAADVGGTVGLVDAGTLVDVVGGGSVTTGIVLSTGTVLVVEVVLVEVVDVVEVVVVVLSLGVVVVVVALVVVVVVAVGVVVLVVVGPVVVELVDDVVELSIVNDTGADASMPELASMRAVTVCAPLDRAADTQLHAPLVWSATTLHKTDEPSTTRTSAPGGAVPVTIGVVDATVDPSTGAVIAGAATDDEKESQSWPPRIRRYHGNDPADVTVIGLTE